MPVVLLVRHAQASFGTADYDRLSELGRQQSRWLGEYFATRSLRPYRVMAGTLRRQRDTATEALGAMGMADTPIVEHAGLNEYPGEALYAAFTQGADPVAHQRRACALAGPPRRWRVSPPIRRSPPRSRARRRCWPTWATR